MNKYTAPMRPHPAMAGYAQTIRLQKSGLDLYCFAAGGTDDPPVLLIHGLGDEADTWHAVLPSIASSNRVIAVDLPGFGRSPMPSQPITVPLFIQIITDLVDTLGFQKVLLVGHSMGAVIAHAFGLNNPERISGLVLVAGSLLVKSQPLNLNMLLFLIPGIGEMLYKGLRRNPQAAYRTLELYYHNLSGLPSADQDFLFERVNQRVWSDTQRKAYFAVLRSLARWVPGQQRGLVERLSKSNVPTSIVWGQLDKINPAANALALKHALPGAFLNVISNAGHNLQQEVPKQVVRAIQSRQKSNER